MTTVLVTGASGFIGANVVRRLLADGHEVHALMRSSSRDWRLDNIRDDVRIHRGDVGDRAAVLDVAKLTRPTWIFHLATHGAYPHERDVTTMIRTNIDGTVAVVQAGIEIEAEAIVLAGSSSEYGYVDHAPRESELLRPNGDYALTKAAASMYGWMAAQGSSVSITTLRLYSVYGPWEEPSRLIPTLAIRGLEGCFPQMASPRISRDFVAVDDVVDAFVRAAASPAPGIGRIYNIGTGTQSTLVDAANVARERLSIPGEPSWGSMPDRTWDTEIWVSDSSLVELELGWRARTPFRDGFGHFVDWLTSHPDLLDRYQRALRK